MADHVPAQATFVGVLAISLFILALVAAVFMVYVGTRAPVPVDVQETPPAQEQAAEPVPGM